MNDRVRSTTPMGPSAIAGALESEPVMEEDDESIADHNQVAINLSDDEELKEDHTPDPQD